MGVNFGGRNFFSRLKQWKFDESHPRKETWWGDTNIKVLCCCLVSGKVLSRIILDRHQRKQQAFICQITALSVIQEQALFIVPDLLKFREASNSLDYSTLWVFMAHQKSSCLPHTEDLLTLVCWSHAKNALPTLSVETGIWTGAPSFPAGPKENKNLGNWVDAVG